MKYLLPLYTLIVAGSIVFSYMVERTALEVSIDSRAILRETEDISRRIEEIRLANCKVASRIIEGRSKVSYYADFFDGRITASGRVFKQDERQIAHKEFPFGSMVFFMAGATRVNSDKRPDNQISTPFPSPASITHGWITDSGPFIAGRDFDLSRGMAQELGIIEEGVATVEWVALLPEGRTE